MRSFHIKDAIITRQFDAAEGKQVFLYIWKPVADVMPHLDYRCAYRITGIGLEKVYWCVGVDALQALVLTLATAASHLYNSEAYKTGGLTYLGSRDLKLLIPDHQNS